MKYIIREKIFTLANKFTIEDLNGEAAYEVVGKLFSFGRKLDIYDAEGNHQLYIEQKIFRLLPEYIIYRDKINISRVSKELTFFKPKYNIESKFGNFTIEGDILAHEFNILKNGLIVAWISKKWVSLSDTYSVDIVPEEDQAFILALAIILDQIHYDKNK